MKKKLIIFTKYPVARETKTRLIPHLGEAKAANLQKFLTETIIKEISSNNILDSIDVEIFFTGGDIIKVKDWIKNNKFGYKKQKDGSLGVKMQDAFNDSFKKGYKSVLLMGSDIYDFKSSYIKDGFDKLKKKDIVIGPSNDGGYWLIGQNQLHEIFDNISWSTKNVLDQTTKQIALLGLDLAFIEKLIDIDTIDDLALVDIDLTRIEGEK